GVLIDENELPGIRKTDRGPRTEDRGLALCAGRFRAGHRRRSRATAQEEHRADQGNLREAHALADRPGCPPSAAAVYAGLSEGDLQRLPRTAWRSRVLGRPRHRWRTRPLQRPVSDGDRASEGT